MTVQIKALRLVHFDWRFSVIIDIASISCELIGEEKVEPLRVIHVFDKMGNSTKSLTRYGTPITLTLELRGLIKLSAWVLL